MSSRPRITVDGNIASGKTTQLTMLENKGYRVLREPIQEWPLESFYDDKKRWAFLLQMTVLKTFIDRSADVYERSPKSSYGVFWKMMCDDGIVTEEEQAVCRYFYETNGWSPDITIYIRTDPSHCYDRLVSRQQTGDSAVSTEYIQKVHKYYEEYANGTNNVYVVDGNQSKEDVHKQILKIIRDDEMLRCNQRGEEV